MTDFEQDVQAVYQSILRPGDLAIDVGAHVGRHTIPMAQSVQPEGKIYAFEPVDACREELARQLAADPAGLREVVEISGIALSDYSGEAEYVVAQDAPGYSGLKKRVYDVPTRVEMKPVAVRRLDELFLDLPALKYIKVDAEGGEYHILRGAAALLDKFRPLVTFEFGVNAIEEYRITPEDLGRFLFEIEYRVYDIRANLLATVEAFVASAQRQHVWDYVAIPVENKLYRDSITLALADQAQMEQP